MRIAPLAAILITSLISAAQAGELKPIMPDEPAEYSYNERFSTESALESIDYIKDSLNSFVRLSKISEKKIGKKRLKTVGNTGWETQNLGFPNWTSTVKGTLLKNDYLMKKLEYKLEKMKLKSGQSNRAEVDRRKKSFKAAEAAFKQFWSTASIAD